jgi:hypothetical protein
MLRKSFLLRKSHSVDEFLHILRILKFLQFIDHALMKIFLESFQVPIKIPFLICYEKYEILPKLKFIININVFAVIDQARPLGCHLLLLSNTSCS